MKKLYLSILVVAALVVVAVCVGRAFFEAREAQKVVVVPFPTVMSRKEVIQESLAKSNALVQSAVKRLNEHRLDDAIRDLSTAIDLLPLNTQAYQLLVKTYLMTKQEERLFETLEKAGRSFPGFDAILSVVDDPDLDRIPLPVEKADIYVAAFKGNKKAAVSFMFDDGESSVYTSILPIFDRFNYKATVSVVPSLVKNEPGDIYWGSWSQWHDAARRGFEIANHSMHHRDAKTYTPDDMKEEIRDAQVLIDKKIGVKTTAYVFPMDSFTDDAMRYALRTHEVVRRPTYLRTFYARSFDIMYGGPVFSVASANRLIDLAVKRNLWVIAEGHGLEIKGYTKNYKPLTSEFVETHLAYVSSRAKDVWVDTFSHIFNYLSMRHEASLERKDVGPRRVDVVLSMHEKKEKLPQALTVVVKVKDKNPVNITASTKDGSSMNAVGCGENLICVDIDTAQEPVTVSWGNNG